jgi:MFS family permease
MSGSLRVPNYRLFISGQLVSLTGTWMQTIAQDWLVLQLSGNSGRALGLVTALQFTPVLLLTLYGGVLADRFNKRKVLIVVQSALGLLALSMGLLILTGTVELWHVFVLATLLGAGQAFDVPTRQAFVSELVGPELLPNAVALNSAAFNSARIVGPAVGGLVIAGVGVGPAFLLNSVSYLAVLFALFRMNDAALFHSERTIRARGQVREGIRYVRERPDLLLVFALVTVIGTLGMNFNLTLPLLSRVEFGVGAASFGLLSTAFAIGALAGALSGSRRASRPRASTQLWFAAGFGAASIAVAFMPDLWLAALLLIPTGGFLIGHNNAANSRVQLGTDPQLRGRVMSLYMLVFLGGTPLGALLIGAVSEAYGPRAGLLIGGSSAVLAAAVLAAARTWRHGLRLRLRRRPTPHVQLRRGTETVLRIPSGRARIAR